MTISRRRFAGVLGSLPALPAMSSLAAGAQTLNPSSWANQFASALEAKPWLMGYQSASSDSFASPAKMSGKWPAELRGTFYRNGPAQHEIGGYRYHHWFDGDGMMQSYQMGDGEVTHQAKLIQTYKVQAEAKAGRALYPGFGSVPPNPANVTGPDDVNVANISVLHHHDKLLALWEAGSAWEMDPETLDTKGTYAFTDHTQGVPFSAHPRVEADGTLWNFGYVSGANIFVLWHIDKNGKLQKIGKIPSDPMTMVHDFIVTQKHIVMLVPPLHYKAGQMTSFLEAHEWHPEDPTRVLIVDKNDFDNHYWLELPSQWVFHFGNGWEDKSGVIRFDAARAADPLVMINSFTDIMRGQVTPAASSHHHQYRIDTRKRTVSEVPLFGNNIDSEFPCVDPRVSCGQNRHLTMLGANSLTPAPHISLNELVRFDLESGNRTFYRYPDTQIPEEHLYVPKPGSAPESSGWVVGTALDWENKVTLMNVFNAENVADGPIAQATLPYALPLGLHGKFVQA